MIQVRTQVQAVSIEQTSTAFHCLQFLQLVPS